MRYGFRKFIAGLLPALLLACAAGCGPLRSANLLTTEQEVALAADFDAQILNDSTALRNHPAVDYVEDLTQRLAAHCKRPDLTYHVKVLVSDDVNAFAQLGGYLYVNTGLILAAESEAELAAVIAHEIAHVVGRHSAQTLTKQVGLELLAEAVSGGEDASDKRKILGGVLYLAGTGFMLKYSREDELEADALAVQNLYDAGIDPFGMASFLGTLARMRGSAPSRLEVFLSTHPAPHERVERARALAERLPPLQAGGGDNRLRRAKAALRGSIR
ncbi:MAG: M48 family metalloprotease [Candidatus Poribacteria bacterium]|nr:M48 family metalloprotease [Candidatus Poribacteria bacterium]